jgi:uncharacterized protein YodC (DUF2158 family)
MENKINIAELLKDCPKGMALDCVLYENVKFECVLDAKCYPIQVQTYEGKMLLSKYGCLSLGEHAKCVIFPKGKTTWEGFQRPFKDGDIVSVDTYPVPWIGIFKRYREVSFESHCCLNDIDFCNTSIKNHSLMGLRFAIEEEKQKLFDAIKSNGYKWNETTKTLEKLVEPKFKVGDKIQNKETGKRRTITKIHQDCYECDDRYVLTFKNQDDWELVPNKFDINTLIPFKSIVLVRPNRDSKWCGSFFSHIDEDFRLHGNKFVTTAVKNYPMCIPYEGNEHLLGTTNDCDEFYKTWE